MDPVQISLLGVPGRAVLWALAIAAFGVFGWRIYQLVGLLRQPQRMITTSLSRRRLKERSQQDLNESAEQIALLESRINALKADARVAFQVIIDRWSAAAGDIHDLRITPRRADILVEAFGVGWM